MTENVSKGKVHQKLGSFPLKALGTTQEYTYSILESTCTYTGYTSWGNSKIPILAEIALAHECFQ